MYLQLQLYCGQTYSRGMTVIELLLLTTVSARSGRLRETPLAHVRYGDDLVVVASNYGSQMNPAWYLDLVAHPIVTVEVPANNPSAARALLRAVSASCSMGVCASRCQASLWPRGGRDVRLGSSSPGNWGYPSICPALAIEGFPRFARLADPWVIRPGLSVCGRLKTCSACEARAPDPTTGTPCRDQSAVGCHKVGA